MYIIYNLIFIFIFAILILVIIDKNAQISSFESVMKYYEWHEAIFNPPKNNCWCLIQTGDNTCQKMRVSFYNIEKYQWYRDKRCIYEENNVVAWCHLPNHLYPER